MFFTKFTDQLVFISFKNIKTLLNMKKILFAVNIVFLSLLGFSAHAANVSNIGVVSYIEVMKVVQEYTAKEKQFKHSAEKADKRAQQIRSELDKLASTINSDSANQEAQKASQRRAMDLYKEMEQIRSNYDKDKKSLEELEKKIEKNDITKVEEIVCKRKGISVLFNKDVRGIVRYSSKDVDYTSLVKEEMIKHLKRQGRYK